MPFARQYSGFANCTSLRFGHALSLTEPDASAHLFELCSKSYNRITLNTRRSALWLTGIAALVAFGAAILGKPPVRPAQPQPLSVTLEPAMLRADGQAIAVLTIQNVDPKPIISITDNIHGASIERIEQDKHDRESEWHVRIRAGVVPGHVGLRIESPDHRSATTELTTYLDDRDSAHDGTPDFLRLDDERDRQAFRRWFTYLAEDQYFESAATRPAEINDCAALIRYAYREALKSHDSKWANSVRLSVIPALDSAAKYQYPFTPLQAALFRAQPGSFHPSELSDGTFLQFADARTLWRFNTHFVSRDLSRAQQGDLLFFRQDAEHITFHSMIYLGESQLRADGKRYVLYHTGPTGQDPGEIRRLTIEELQRFPQPEWWPVASNPSFLGVYRWNIL